MKILGFDINRANTAAEKKGRFTETSEIGNSGTDIFDGIITEDHNHKLEGINGIDVYNKMRKSDGTINATILATSLPIMRANWFIKPASDDPRDIEIQEFVDNALFEWLEGDAWEDVLRQALLSLPLGVYLFEKVFMVKEADGKQYITWKKFAPRMPKSVHAWQTEDGQDGIQQLKSDGNIVNIPMERLLVFTNRKEGDNWWGFPMLRPAYKHWRFKDGFYNIDAVAHERQGLGIPKAKMPESYTEADRARAVTILKNLRAHEQQYIIEPHDIEVEFMDMKAGTTRNPKESIMHHNREIVKSILAQFLELGASGGGSRALSSDQTDLFLQSLESVARSVANVFNRHAIQQLVDLNFDDVTEYPKLDFKGISRQKVGEIATAYKTLIDAQAIKTSPEDERHWRESLGLPERDMDDDEDVGEPATTIPEGDDDDEGGIAEELQNSETGKKKEFAEKFVNTDNSDFTREMTFAEEKVDFDKLKTQMDAMEKNLSKDAKKILLAEKEKFMVAFSKAANAGDVPAMKKAVMGGQVAYTALLKKDLKKSFEIGKNSATREMKKDAIANSAKVAKQIDLAATTIAEQQLGQVTASAKLAYNEQAARGKTAAIALAFADKKAIEKITKFADGTPRIVVAGFINNGRRTVFETFADDIYGLQRSELLDSSTCNFCLSIDGRIIEKDDDLADTSIFHSGCRGIWVEILMDEENKPKIDGVPDSLRSSFGDAVNDLIQPKTPKNKGTNTEAKKEIKKRRDKRIEKQRKEK